MRPLVLATALAPVFALLAASAVAAPEEAVRSPAAETPAASNQGAAAPSASDLLFDQPQMRNTAPGSTIRYSYLRRSGISKGPYGAPINDEIRLTVAAGKAPDNRDIRVQMFSGANRTPAGPFENMSGNPVLSLFLESHLMGVAGLLDANPRYIKNAIRKGLRERATVTPTTIDFEGRKVEGWRVVTQPFTGDPETVRLRGFEGLTYTFVTSDAVPGEIVSIEAQAHKPDGGELLEEKLTYDKTAG